MNRSLLLVTGLAWALQAQTHSAMPPGMSHEEHRAQMKKEAELKEHGALAMGFDQDAAWHRFRLSGNGGRIEVRANSEADTTTRSQIREHLRQIAAEFQEGNFGKPLITHDETPPGVATMQQLRSKIEWRYEETAQGGMVRVRTRDRAARNAIHDFLRYQIREHKTGDPLTIER